MIGYSSIDSNKKISDITYYGNITSTTNSTTNGTAKFVTVPDSDAMNDKDTYIGGNESTDTKYITVNDRKFKITADTVVLRVDSDADEDADIGQAYTYGTTTMTKAQKKSSNPDVYTENVMFVMNEKTDADDDNTEIAVLVIDSTGAFKGHKIADSTPSTPTLSDKTYVRGDATVKVYDSSIVTDAQATYNTKDAKMTVQLTVDKSYTTKHDDKITVTVNGVKKTATIGTTLTDGTVQLTVSCDKGDKVVVNVAKDAFTK